MADRRTGSGQRVPDLNHLAEDLLDEVMGKVEGVSGTFYILDMDQTFRAVCSRGEGRSAASRVDPGEVLRRHEEIFQGTPFFEQRSGKLVFDSFFLPLVFNDMLTGLAHFEVKPSAKPAAQDLRMLSETAKQFASLIHNALVQDRIRKDPLKDLDTNSYNESFLLDFLRREISRSRRHRRRLSLMVLELEGGETFQKKQGYRVVQSLLRDVSEAVRGIAREQDVVAHVGNFRFLIALPDTDRVGCRIAMERQRRGIRQLAYLRERLERYKLVTHFGFSCFPEDGRDQDALLISALSRARESRRDIFQRETWREKPFWETFEGIMKSPGREEVENAPETSHGAFTTSFFYLLQEAIANDISRHPARRGFLYIGTNNIYVTEALIQKNPLIAKVSTRVSVLGNLSGMQSLRELNINAISIPEELSTAFQFIILMTDRNTYAIMAVLKKENLWSGFHSSNESLVESLAFKLRYEYGLQEQI